MKLKEINDEIYYRCVVCYEPFTKEEWEDRHSTPDGEDCHAHCCPECLDELLEAFRS